MIASPGLDYYAPRVSVESQGSSFTLHLHRDSSSHVHITDVETTYFRPIHASADDPAFRETYFIPLRILCTPRALLPEWLTLCCFDSSLYSPYHVGTATRLIQTYSGFHVTMRSDVEYFPASQVHLSSVLKPRTDRVHSPLGPIRRNPCSIQWEGCLTCFHPHSQSFHWLCLFVYGLPRMVEHAWMT